MTEKIRVDILVKRNETFIKKKRNKLRHSLKEIRVETFVLNIYKTRETTIYKRLSRRLILQEMNTIK